MFLHAPLGFKQTILDRVTYTWKALQIRGIKPKKGYIRISQPLNMLNIKPVMRFIRISNARNSVNFCAIFPCAKDSSWTRRKIKLRSDELNGGPFSRRLIFCWIDIINSIYSLNSCWEIRIDPYICICDNELWYAEHKIKDALSKIETVSSAGSSA